MQIMSFINPGTSHILEVSLEKRCSRRARLLHKRMAVEGLTKDHFLKFSYSII